MDTRPALTLPSLAAASGLVVAVLAAGADASGVDDEPRAAAAAAVGDEGEVPRSALPTDVFVRSGGGG